VSLRLRCTVRGCAEPLTRDADRLRCPRGHAFDRAREGYWNLLQPQDRKSANAGDREAAIEARRRWLRHGFADGLVATLRGIVDALAIPPGSAAADAGCGEGTITTGVLSGRGLAICGIDLSARAVGLAARLDPGGTWIVANADRALPLADGSARLVLSIFGRRPAAELARVLTPDGALVVAIPAEDDLIELRVAVQGTALRRDRVPAVLEELAPAFVLERRAAWRHRARHDRETQDDALAMSYRGARSAERARTAGLAAGEVTLAADILVLRRGSNRIPNSVAVPFC
jgi:23S rRNA (guanine745-N1)-methyltransferase